MAFRSASLNAAADMHQRRAMTGADYIARFLQERGTSKVFLMTGGACAFIVDGIARCPGIDYVCFQHEQAAAIAADAVWRTDKTVGATVATSGPGAVNLLTGIACSYFDSIPTIHITGQVNNIESARYLDAKVRQAGFQETNIVDMAKPVTKYAVKVRSVEELKHELTKAYNIAITHRMGPVLVDVPMDVQQQAAGDRIEYEPPSSPRAEPAEIDRLRRQLKAFFAAAERPAVLVGGGLGLAGVADRIVAWIEKNRLPFLSSWHGMSHFNHDSPQYCGPIGVYGNRGANSILQNCDALLVLGSRLENRQRSGNPRTFAPGARVHVVDVDPEELKKYAGDGYATTQFDLRHLPSVVEGLAVASRSKRWSDYVDETKSEHFGKNRSTFAEKHGTLSPYEVVRRIAGLLDAEAAVVVDAGGHQCWVHQSFHRTTQTFFTSGGMAPMGYALPAAIGAALTSRSGRQVVAFTGDGGLQVNLQELQTLRHCGLNVKIVVMNNKGYGIIKQFQDSYFGGRYEASGRGYSAPDFGGIARAYGLNYQRVERLGELTPALFAEPGPAVIDVIFHENTLIEPRLEMGRPINDQFPYLADGEFAKLNPFYNGARRNPAT